MDPNAALARIRFFTRKVRDERLVSDERSEYGQDLANSIEDLDEWLSKGGFLPADWAR